MRHFASALGLAGLLASPVAAQIVGRPDPGPPPSRDLFPGDGFRANPAPPQLRSLRRQIERARDDGTITRREARRMRRELRRVAGMPASAAVTREASARLVRADLDRARRRDRAAGAN